MKQQLWTTCLKTWLFVLLSVVMTNVAAQTFEYPEYEDDTIRICVVHTGAQPTITDFATAYLNHKKDDNKVFKAVREEWIRHQQKKLPGDSCTTMLVDTKNGYWRYEHHKPAYKDTVVVEMCYWNCKDGKHKLLAVNGVWKMEEDYGYDDFVGTQFFLYDKTERTMRNIWAEDIGALYDGDGLSIFFLPRKGKDIRVSAAGGGERWDEVLEWDGFQFSSRAFQEE